ncbi:MAG: alpha-glucosidase [Lachnospiraceae bacterium]|nr:alpha-glucosidase [Lachnospiraceae bacterium]
MQNTLNKKWWHNKVAYEIYPKSFMDANGDGVGDLQGIISKLDYLKELGIDILWICPIYESPFVDQGYDIADYYKIADCFGSMDDFEQLIEETKKRDMYVIMDLVVNHCSDKHTWFTKALENPEGEYGKRFYFERGKDGKEPSNYRSYFGGSMWEPVPGYNDLYYYHAFAKEQPDLNWNNDEVVQAVYDMVNWWLAKGVAGFRIDAIINIKKDTSFPSYEPDGPDGLCETEKTVSGALSCKEGPSIGQMLSSLKEHTFARHDAFTVGEVFNLENGTLQEFIGRDGHFSTIFDFSLHLLTNCEHGWFAAHKITFRELRKTIFDSQLATQKIGFMANIIENHDEPRGLNIFLPEWIDREAGAKLLGTIMVMQHGIPFLYQGQEIGMTNMDFTTLNQYNDISTIDQYHQAIDRGFTDQEALSLCNTYSRDNARTVMQWDDTENAGFSTGTPWFHVNPNYKEINVKSQLEDACSILSYYRALIALRKNSIYENVFVYGMFEPAYEEYDNVLAFYRKSEQGGYALVVSNWGESDVTITLTDEDKSLWLMLDSMSNDYRLSVALKNAIGQKEKKDQIILKPGQVCVYG